MAFLGADDIQGKQHGFLSGNHVFYVAGVYLVQNLVENETIGLPHPFFNDLRARGTSLACDARVGCGNDFRGWEFYRGVKVAMGTVLYQGIRFERPNPTHLYWSPDKLVIEYTLNSPYLQGVYANGWCSNWAQIPGSAVTSGTQSECWARCDAEPLCEQARHEYSTQSWGNQCWLGSNFMTHEQTPSATGRGFCSDTQWGCVFACYAKGRTIPTLNIREEKFVSLNDVISTTITADASATIEFNGNSFDGTILASDVRDSFVPNATCRANVGRGGGTWVHVLEGGVVNAKVTETGNHHTGHGGDYGFGRLMYDGMSAVIGASRPMTNMTIIDAHTRVGVCAYVFELPLDNAGVTLSWTMHDDYATALANVRSVVASPATHKQDKTDHLNELLNYGIPYFRCSDSDLVKVYYYLWAINLMYYTHGDSGMEIYPHTQSAVHNFLGMHRFDGVMQIFAGAWTSPDRHTYYANGNVLVWNMTMAFARTTPSGHLELADNFGIGWVSGLYGPETIAHVVGACTIWEHSGNTTFLALAYDFYKRLFWGGISGRVWGYAYDGALCLMKMAEALGMPEDVPHWNATANFGYLETWLNSNWEMHTPGLFGSTSFRIDWGNLAPMGSSVFPREWAMVTTERWINNTVSGFAYGDVPLLCVARDNWTEPVDPSIGADYNFAVTPDANFYMLRGLYKQQLIGIANGYALAHLKKYNMRWGIPVAPEALRMNFEMHGDQYSNFNAGKILTFIEGLGGLHYSAVDDTFAYADNMPTNWSFVEWRVPVPDTASGAGSVRWVKARTDRVEEAGQVTKTASVNANPFGNLVIQPWAEDANVASSSPPGHVVPPPLGRVGWHLNATDVSVVLTLG